MSVSLSALAVAKALADKAEQAARELAARAEQEGAGVAEKQEAADAAAVAQSKRATEGTSDLLGALEEMQRDVTEGPCRVPN